MGSVNHGTQDISWNFYEELTSRDFNERNMNIQPRGIYKGGYLTRVSDAEVSLSPLTAEIGDTVIQVSISTAVAATLNVSTLDSGSISSATPVLVLRWAYTASAANYMEIHAIASAAVALSNDIIIGKCNFSGATLVDFDYANRTFLTIQDLFLKVESSSGLYVQLRAGRIQTATGYVQIPETLVGPFSVPGSPNSRIDLIYIDTDGTVSIAAGAAAPSPSAPSYARRLVVAEIRIANGDTTIPASRITDVRSFISKNFDMSPVTYVGGESVTHANGLIEKMGKTATPVGNLAYNGTVTVTFATPFPNGIKSVVGNMKNTAGYGAVVEIYSATVNAVVFRYTESDIGIYEACDGIYWMAKGW